MCIPVVRGEGRPENALRLLLLQRTYARSTEEAIDTETSVGILMTHLAISGGVDFSNADVKNHLLKSSIQVETVEIGAPELPMMGELVTGTATLKSYAGEVEACKKQLAVLEHKEEEEEGDDDRKLEITEEIRTISEVTEKFERFHNLVKTGATKEEQKMEWFTMMSMLMVSDAKASRSTENYRQYIQRRLGAFLAVTLTGTTETGENREVTEIPSFAFSVKVPACASCFWALSNQCKRLDVGVPYDASLSSTDKAVLLRAHCPMLFLIASSLVSSCYNHFALSCDMSCSQNTSLKHAITAILVPKRSTWVCREALFALVTPGHLLSPHLFLNYRHVIEYLLYVRHTHVRQRTHLSQLWYDTLHLRWFFFSVCVLLLSILVFVLRIPLFLLSTMLLILLMMTYVPLNMPFVTHIDSFTWLKPHNVGRIVWGKHNSLMW